MQNRPVGIDIFIRKTENKLCSVTALLPVLWWKGEQGQDHFFTSKVVNLSLEGIKDKGDLNCLWKEWTAQLIWATA